MRRRAFSVVELLVVATILALLAALLFPAFAAARASAKATANLSNLRQLGNGVLLYVADHNETYPLAVVLNAPSGSGAPYTPWSESTLPYTKSRAIGVSPLEGAPSGNDAAQRVQSAFYYGVVPRSSFGGAPAVVGFTAPNALGFASVSGPFGYAVAGGVAIPSLVASAVAAPAGTILVADAGRWDMGLIQALGKDGYIVPPESGSATAVMTHASACFTAPGSAPPGWAGRSVGTGPWARRNAGNDRECLTEAGGRGGVALVSLDGSAHTLDLRAVYETREMASDPQRAFRWLYTGAVK